VSIAGPGAPDAVLRTAGQHGLASNIGVEKEVRVGEQQRDAIEPAQGQGRALQEALASIAEVDGRIRWQRAGDESANLLVPRAEDLLASGHSSFHGPSIFNDR